MVLAVKFFLNRGAPMSQAAAACGRAGAGCGWSWTTQPRSGEKIRLPEKFLVERHRRKNDTDGDDDLADACLWDALRVM